MVISIQFVPSYPKCRQVTPLGIDLTCKKYTAPVAGSNLAWRRAPVPYWCRPLNRMGLLELLTLLASPTSCCSNTIGQFAVLSPSLDEAPAAFAATPPCDTSRPRTHGSPPTGKKARAPGESCRTSVCPCGSWFGSARPMGLQTTPAGAWHGTAHRNIPGQPLV